MRKRFILAFGLAVAAIAALGFVAYRNVSGYCSALGRSLHDDELVRIALQTMRGTDRRGRELIFEAHQSLRNARAEVFAEQVLGHYPRCCELNGMEHPFYEGNMLVRLLGDYSRFVTINITPAGASQRIFNIYELGRCGHVRFNSPNLRPASN